MARCVPVEGKNGMKAHACGLPGGAGCVVYEHGAHLCGWTDATGEELLFVSDKAVFAPPKAIRGGVPVCFPQFSDLGETGMQHGFARNTAWQLAESDETSMTFALADNEETMATWPHHFGITLRYEVDLATAALTATAMVHNPSADTPLAFTFALHTYFAVGSAREAAVEGLQGVTYLDSLQGRKEVVEAAPEVRFEGEVDRIYLGVPGELRLRDGGRRTFSIQQTNLPDAVVWNPWVDKSAAMADFGDEEYEGMVCVESASCGRPVEVGPGETWSGSVRLCPAV